MQRNKDPAEIGKSDDAELPADGAGVGDDVSLGVRVELAGAAEEPGDGDTAGDCGESPGAAAGVSDNPQLEAEGAETLHAAGRARALVTLRTTPN